VKERFAGSSCLFLFIWLVSCPLSSYDTSIFLLVG
jgi:hypothetical protein